jgi:hypothetical protein
VNSQPYLHRWFAHSIRHSDLLLCAGADITMQVGELNKWPIDDLRSFPLRPFSNQPTWISLQIVTVSTVMLPLLSKIKQIRER